MRLLFISSHESFPVQFMKQKKKCLQKLQVGRNGHTEEGDDLISINQ